MPDESLDVGTVVKISEVLNKQYRDVVHLFPGLEGIVSYHNAVFKLDDETPALEQEGSVKKEDEMYYFVMPGSNIRIGPVARMTDDHKVICWIVGGKLHNVTGMRVLFNGCLRWSVVRSGEVLTLR